MGNLLLCLATLAKNERCVIIGNLHGIDAVILGLVVLIISLTLDKQKVVPWLLVVVC